MNIKAELVQRTSKAGLPYVAVELTLSNNYKKLVFLNQAELELIKVTSQSPVQTK